MVTVYDASDIAGAISASLNATNIGRGMSFEWPAGGYDLTAATWYMAKNGSPTGAITCAVYNTSTFVPSGAAIGSDTTSHLAEDLGAAPSYAARRFVFDPITVAEGADLCISYEHGGDSGNNITAGAKTTVTQYNTAFGVGLWRNVLNSGTWGSASNAFGISLLVEGENPVSGARILLGVGMGMGMGL